MFLINNDEKKLERLASRGSVRSWDSMSTTTSSAVPSNTMIKALIRDLSFWDAIPPAGYDAFPSPLPQKPPLSTQSLQQQQQHQEQPKFLLQRGRNVSVQDASRREHNRQGNSSRGTLDSRQQTVWKAAVDPMTGRTYYYDAVTRRTQWEKPPEVRQMEKQKKAQRRKRDRLFFQEMEKNILKSLRRGEMVPGIPKARLEPSGPPLEPRNANPLGARNFRTLSRMDDTILAELRHDVVTPEEFDRALAQSNSKRTGTKPRSTSRGRPPLPGQNRSTTDRSRSRSRSHRHSLDASSSDNSRSTVNERARSSSGNRGNPLPRSSGSNSTGNANKPEDVSASDKSRSRQETGDNPAGPDGLAGAHFLHGPIEAEIQALAVKSVGAMKNQHVRRNTGGTIHINGTMSNPNVEATIKCVCGVYRAHLLQASEERSKHSPVSVMSKPLDLGIFHDRYHLKNARKHTKQQESLPSMADIVEFYQEFYRRSQMEFDTIIMSLIYVERLIKTTNLTPGPENWRSILFSCMVLASKVWDDLSMWNIDFSNVASAQSSNQSEGLSLFTLQRVNQLELILLKSLNFDVRVPASEYAKYYFLIRTMLMRSGLLDGAAKLLGKEEAKILENRTSQYQDSKLNNQNNQRGRRAKSMYDYSWLEKSSEQQQEGGELTESGPGLQEGAC